MAYVTTEAIIDRARALIEDGVGSARAISAGTYDDGLYDGLSDDAQSLRALDTPIVETSITSGPSPHASNPPINSTIHMMDIELTVRVVRSSTLIHKLDTAQRYALAGAVSRDSDVIRQALTYPGNMTGCGLVSDLLMHTGTSGVTFVTEDAGSRVETSMTFTGIILVTQATS